MFFLLLTLALDMSRPEFQPEPDVSGNYIVSSVSENDLSVELLSELPPITYTAVDEADNTAIVDAINESISHNDAYWELFLDSYVIEINHSLASLDSRRNTGWIVNQGVIETTTSPNYYLAPCPVSSGVAYTVDSISMPSYNTFVYYVVDDLDNPTTVTNVGRLSPFKESFNFTASQDGYFVMQINYGSPFGSYVLKWTTEERDSYTLSEIGNAVTQSYDKLTLILMCLSGCELLLVFSAVVPFLTKIVDKLMNKKED